MGISNIYNSGGFHTEAYNSINSLERQVKRLTKELASLHSAISSMKTDIHDLKKAGQESGNGNRIPSSPLIQVPNITEFNADVNSEIEHAINLFDGVWSEEQVRDFFDKGWNSERLANWYRNYVLAQLQFPQWTEEQIRGYLDNGWTKESLQSWIDNQ